MNIVSKLFVLFIFIGFGYHSYAQSHPPKRELRGVWIATVGNIDWPSKRGLSAQQQQQEYIQYLDFFKSLGFNAVFVQVRPAADAFYKSSYEPWSAYLSGKQGVAPEYDPLEFMIREAHKRNMEVHAWFNPYRALVNSSRNPNPESHATRQHPNWMIHYGGKSYFDPGNPDTRKYILKVIMEAVQKYDMDAVHIDDYFYPYKIAGQPFRDNASYSKYGKGMKLEDWRRENVNTFISELYSQIKKEKPWMQFGVSPFGIWRNIKNDPTGSATNGSSCYDDLYSDVLLWAKNNWVDYLAPQLYWARNSKAASYSVLLPWWMKQQYRAQTYIGLGTYRMVNAKPGTAWDGPGELLEQIRMGREMKANGYVFFSASSFRKINSALQDSLRNSYFSTIAFPPASWISEKKPAVPVLDLATQNDGSVKLNWTKVNSHENELMRYAIYRFAETESVNIDNPTHIIALTQNNSFVDRTLKSGKKYRYVVTAVNRFWNESPASNQKEVIK